jgi:hypothetical protein
MRSASAFPLGSIGLLLLAACSSNAPGGAGSSGGVTSAGHGGSSATGGAATATGGVFASGGTTASGGQSAGAGAMTAPGGRSAVGGTASGGVTQSGGEHSEGGGGRAASSGGTGGRGNTGGASNAGAASNGGAANAGAGAANGGAANGGAVSSGGGVSAGGVGGGTSVAGPCDIYGAASTPCVAAHSIVRALYGAYAGKLYQVKRSSDGTTKDISVLAPGGFANAAEQDSFCDKTTCTVSLIYDQSPKANHLTTAPAGGAVKTPDKGVNASKLKLTVGGHSVYGAYFEGGMGYRNNKTSGIATGDQPQSMYMVTSGKHYNGGCCFDYGNAETTNNDDGNGTMEAIYFGNCTGWGRGSGSGPWVMADLENGLFGSQTFSAIPSNVSLSSEYVTAVVKGKPGGFALKGADAQAGTLKTLYEGARPTTNGYNPMKKQGAIILGIGGDNSNSGVGTFFEGCMTSGYSDDGTDAAIQANIVGAGYGH